MNLVITVMILMIARALPSEGAPGQCVYVCPADWHHFQGNCYRYYSERVTWQLARHRCRGVGGDLVSIHSQQENHFAYYLMLSSECITPTAGDTYAWIGYYQTTPASTGNFVWSDGSRSNFESWSPGQPDNYHGAEDCGHYFKFGPAASWNDRPCSDRIGYICKKAPINV